MHKWPNSERKKKEKQKWSARSVQHHARLDGDRHEGEVEKNNNRSERDLAEDCLGGHVEQRVAFNDRSSARPLVVRARDAANQHSCNPPFVLFSAVATAWQVYGCSLPQRANISARRSSKGSSLMTHVAIESPVTATNALRMADSIEMESAMTENRSDQADVIYQASFFAFDIPLAASSNFFRNFEFK